MLYSNAIAGRQSLTTSYAGATFTAGDGSMFASWSGTGLLQDSIDIGAGDYTSIAVNVIPGAEQ